MRNLGEVELFEVDLQHLILNYLTINGLAEAAEEFVKEARIEREQYAAESLFSRVTARTIFFSKRRLCPDGLLL